jgi:hypothetical protein
MDIMLVDSWILKEDSLLDRIRPGTTPTLPSLRLSNPMVLAIHCAARCLAVWAWAAALAHALPGNVSLALPVRVALILPPDEGARGDREPTS